MFVNINSKPGVIEETYGDLVDADGEVQNDDYDDADYDGGDDTDETTPDENNDTVKNYESNAEFRTKPQVFIAQIGDTILLPCETSDPGLTPDEEKNLLLLMEDDISDISVDLESSDDEHFLNNARELLSDSGPTLLNDLIANASFEIDHTSSDEEDNLPLSTFVKKNTNISKKKKTNCIWEKFDIQRVNSYCNVTFTNGARDLDMTPLAYFKLFFDDGIINNIVEQTNLYSVQKTGHSVNTSYTEMCQYFGINILSGIIRMPSYRMYWAQETRIPVIADAMSRNRFEKLRSMLHLADNSQMKSREDPEYDKCLKQRGEIKYKKLLVFRSEIAHALLQKDVNILYRKRGRPTNETVPSPTPPPKRPVNPTPINDVRYDNLGHWPQHQEPKKDAETARLFMQELSVANFKIYVVLVWQKNENEFLYQGDVAMRNFPNMKKYSNGTLAINITSEKDFGKYACKMMISQNNSPYIIHTIVPPTAPKIIAITSADNKTVYQVRETLKLTCLASGYPKPKITWHRDNERLGIEDKPVVSIEKYIVNSDKEHDTELKCTVHAYPVPFVVWKKNGKNIKENAPKVILKRRLNNIENILIIRNLTDEDFGSYTCSAKNKFDKVEKSIKVVKTPVVQEFVKPDKANRDVKESFAYVVYQNI
ncbi:hypothetical protein NQ314_021431 [Rhamnusium bicolor]|uniref:Ig-like domain-containing protein n=1 Tax=Rhamnusium bicolor TaxID=1586634 RepID=A0AAV8WI44_9CUCU|nr:hypothetical protein NQ314_021431 [Rhamnusium bicolor]